MHRETRPWGEFTVLVDEEDYKIKELIVRPLGRLSLQSHQRRTEYWIVIEGTANVTLGDEHFRINEGGTIFIPKGVKHRLDNDAGRGLLRIIEVQRGTYFGEDDITRYKDDYGRADTK